MKNQTENFENLAAPAKAVGRASASRRAAFVISDVALPEKDERDEAIKSLDAKCREICNLAHDVRDADRELFALQHGGGGEKLVAAAVKFGTLRERIYNLKDEIERDLRHYNQERGFCICVSHTQEGLPVRVAKARKVPLWGP